MAVYTSVSYETLQHFLSDYDLGSVLSFKGIAEGVENTNYLLHTSKGQYILTLYEKRVAEADLPFFLGLMQHLQARGIACPLPVAAKDEKLYRPLLGRPAAVISFLDGLWIREPAVNHVTALGENLARFHLTAEDFLTERPNTLGLKDWRALYEKCRDKADDVVPGLRGVIDEALQETEKNWPSNLPSGVIHGDLFPDNVFFLDDKLSGIIDFYFACNEFLAYDIAICINAWCFDDDLNFKPDMANAMVHAYSNVRSLSPTELETLPTQCQGAAIRFLLTRLHDWIFHPDGAMVKPKDPSAFASRLKFFMDAQSPADLGIKT